MKVGLNKLNLLDKCIDGNVDNLHELLDIAFDHFNTFYDICKHQVGARNISGVAYKGMVDSRATFDIIYVNDSFESNLPVDEEVMNHIIVERTPHGISLNISLREE